MVSQRVQIAARAIHFCIISWLSLVNSAGQCRSRGSMNGNALDGHTFTSLLVTSPSECAVKCENEPRCQSYNYVIAGKLCELNNRTQESKPGNLVNDPGRFYMTKWIDRGMCKGTNKERFL